MSEQHGLHFEMNERVFSWRFAMQIGCATINPLVMWWDLSRLQHRLGDVVMFHYNFISHVGVHMHIHVYFHLEIHVQ